MAAVHGGAEVADIINATPERETSDETTRKALAFGHFKLHGDYPSRSQPAPLRLLARPSAPTFPTFADAAAPSPPPPSPARDR